MLLSTYPTILNSQGFVTLTAGTIHKVVWDKSGISSNPPTKQEVRDSNSQLMQIVKHQLCMPPTQQISHAHWTHLRSKPEP